ncbi:class II aldolase/adducin N-terminal [Aspergillus recurvatus]
MSGHISLRDPGFPDRFWTNPLGLHFGIISPSDMILVDEMGVADVNAACHFHSTYGKAWSAFAQPLEMLNQDVAMFYGKAQSIYKEFGGVVLKEDESATLASALGKEGKGMILRNHGLLTVGSTVDEAAYLFLLMEKSCQIQLAADAAAAAGREKVYIGDEAAKFTFVNTSEAESLCAEFQVYLKFESAVSHDGYMAL